MIEKIGAKTGLAAKVRPMTLQVFVESSPPSKRPSEFERGVLKRLKAARNRWFLVQMQSSAIAVPSFLADNANVETEIGIRKLSEFEPGVLDAMRDKGLVPIDPAELPQQKIECLWARWVPKKNTKKAASAPSVTNRKRYPKAVTDLSLRLFRQAKLYNPNSFESIGEEIADSKQWLDTMNHLVNDISGGASTVEKMLDFIFGTPSDSLESYDSPDMFWATVVDTPAVLQRNERKIRDAMHKEAIRSDRIAKKQQSEKRKF